MKRCGRSWRSARPSSVERTVMTLSPARRVWDVVEPIAANVYFAPEVHRAFQDIGFDGPSRVARGIEFPDMLAYFTSRGACSAPTCRATWWRPPSVSSSDPTVVAAVEEGMAAHRSGRRSSAARRARSPRCGGCSATSRRDCRGSLRCCSEWRDAGPAEGHYLHSGLLSLGYPGDPMGDFWRAADLVREHRGDSHIAAWLAADLDAIRGRCAHRPVARPAAEVVGARHGAGPKTSSTRRATVCAPVAYSIRRP